MSEGSRGKGARAAGPDGRMPLWRRVHLGVLLTVAYFGLFTVSQLVLPWGDWDLGKMAVFAVAWGLMAVVTFPAWSDAELARRVREQLPTGETLTEMLPVRTIPERRPHWFVPDNRVLVLTGSHLTAYARNRLTGSPTHRLWLYSLADPTATITLSTDRKRLTLTTAAPPEALGAADVEHFFVQLTHRKPAARFVTLSRRGATTE